MIRIITDSVSSITQEMAAQLDIQVVTLYVNRNGREYEDATMDLDAFYADIYDMVDDIPTSSQPSQHLLEEVFEDAARAGDQASSSPRAFRAPMMAPCAPSERWPRATSISSGS